MARLSIVNAGARDWEDVAVGPGQELQCRSTLAFAQIRVSKGQVAKSGALCGEMRFLNAP